MIVQTNYGELALEIDERTGHARRVPAAQAERAPTSRHARVPTGDPTPRYKSKLEASWAQHLAMLQLGGEIDGWTYEPINFRLPGRKNFYKIDFSAWKGRAVTFYEVKGRNKSDDRSLVKLKTAAGLNPWAHFIQVKRFAGAWQERIFSV